MSSTIRRRAAEKELRLAAGYVKTRDEYEAQGAKSMGTLGMALKGGYYTPAGCERLGEPVKEEEFAKIEYFAMFADCYQDQCISKDGNMKRPCLPVFFRQKNNCGNRVPAVE